MRKEIRKILSLCLVLTMVLSLLPLPALAVETEHTLCLPVIEEGDEAPEPQGYGNGGFAIFSLVPYTTGCTYAYVGADSIRIEENAIIYDPETDKPVTEEPESNGLLQVVDKNGEVLASSEAIDSYYEDDGYWYVSYVYIEDTGQIPAGTYNLRLSAGNEVYPCSGDVIIVGTDSLLITEAYINGLYANVGSFEVRVRLYGFETEADLANLSFQLLDGTETVVAESTGSYRDLSSSPADNSWRIYAQMQVKDGQSIQSDEDYSLKISFAGDKTLVDGVGAVTRSADTPSVTIADFQVLDPQTGSVQVTLEYWSKGETYCVTVSEGYNSTEYGSWEGVVPDSGNVPISLQLNGMTVPMTSYESQFYVEVYEGEDTYSSDSEYFDNPYYNLDQGYISFSPFFIKPSATAIPFTIEYYDCSYVTGEDDVFVMRDSTGTEVGGCSSITDNRDGTSGTLTGTLSITGSLISKKTYYLYLNNVQFDTVYVTEDLTITYSMPMLDYSSRTFWMNLGRFPVEVDAINSTGTASIVFKQDDKDVLSSGDIVGAVSEYDDHLQYAYTFTDLSLLKNGETYTLVFRDSNGTEMMISTDLTYNAEKTALDFSNNNHAFIRWYNAAAGDTKVEAQIYVRASNGPKNITTDDLQAAVESISLSNGSDTILVTGYKNGAWSDNNYTYEFELVLSGELTAGDYTAYFDQMEIDYFTVEETEQDTEPQIYSADAGGGYISGVYLPTDGVYTGKLYQGYTCLTGDAFSMTLQGENDGDTQYLYFSKTLLANLDPGEYEVRVYMGDKLLGSATFTVQSITQPIVTVTDDDDDWYDEGDVVMNTKNAYIEGSNMGAYGYLRWAETEVELEQADFEPYFTAYSYEHIFTGDDGPRMLYVEMSKTGDPSAADNLTYTFNLWLCTDGDYDVQVPEEIQGIQNPADDTYTITATTELPATNVWVAFYDADGKHGNQQMTYIGKTDDGRYEFSLAFQVGEYDSFYDYDSYDGWFYYKDTQFIQVFATNLSDIYNQNEAYRGSIMGIPVERVLVFGDPSYIILPQFAKGGVLTNQTSHTVYGYATPNSTVTVESIEIKETGTANGFGFFSITLSNLAETRYKLNVSDSNGVKMEETDAAYLTVDCTAPVIDNVGFTFLGGSSAVVRWSCVDTDVDYFQVYKNDVLLGRAAATSTSYNVVASAGDGNTFKIEAVDKAGNVGEKTVSTADTETPTAPGTPEETDKTTTSVTLSWTAGTDDIGVAGYNIYQDGTMVAETAGESVLTYTVTGLAQGTEYSFTVRTRDQAGNLSPDSAELTVSTVALTLSSPALQESYIVDEFSDKRIDVAFTVSDNSQDYEVSLNSARIMYRMTGAEESDPWSTDNMTYSGNGASGYWDISGNEDGYLPMGNYDVRFVAEDSEGAEVTSSSINVILLKRDDEPPTAPGVPTAESHSTTSITFHWNESTDNVGVDHYEVYRDDVKIGESTSASYTDTGLEMGKSYSYTVKAVDALGNTSEASTETSLSTMTLEFDKVMDFEESYTMEEQADKQIAVWAEFAPETGYAPDVTVSMEYKALSLEEWTSIELTADETDKNLFKGVWPLDGSVSGYMPEGSYTVRFVVTDGSATLYSNTQTVSLQRDVVKPQMTSLTPTSGTYGGKALSLYAAATDNVGVTSIVLSYSADGNDFTEITTMTNVDGGSPFNNSYTWDASALASGSYTLKATAYDLRGNESDAMTSEITIDNTPPETPGSFTVTGTSLYIHVMWDSDYQAPGDFHTFNVYRAIAQDGEYTRVGGTETIGYFDDGETAMAGTTYYYYVTAEDEYGNESAHTPVLSATLVADSESPAISDMLPREGASLRKSVTLSVAATDNYRLAKAVFEYLAQGTSEWTTIGEKAVTAVTNNTTFTYNWDISALAGGTYEIRASVYDDSINNVEAGSGYSANAPATLIRTVTVKAYSAPIAPVVTVQSGYKTAMLSWTYNGSMDTLKQFEIYKTDVNGANAEYVGTVNAGTTGSYTAAIPVEGTQYFKIAARDKYSEYAYSNVVSVTSTSSDTVDPVAVIFPETLAAAVGVPFNFSGAGSTDNDTIVSYAWDFGDEATGTGKDCIHIYSTAGTYTVKLTVTDDCGNTDEATATMMVYDVASESATHALMTIRVVNGYAEGTPAIEGAAVKVHNLDGINGDDYFDTSAVTDANGQATFVVPIGDCTVTLAADGYVATGRVVTVEPEEDGTFSYTVGLTPVNVSTVDGSLTSTEMTYEEILAADIDVTDPDNEHVWKFSAEFRFAAGPDLPIDLPVTAYYNKAGSFVGGSGWGWVSSGWGGLNIGLFPISENFILVIYGEAHWLKEMYNVELLVINNSHIDDITDCVATLALPEGLSLAAMIGYEQTEAIQLGTIGHKDSSDDSANTAKANWYVRGDAEGEYNLTATVTGNNPTPFVKDFTTDKPVKVYAGSALHLTITAEDIAYRGEEYHVQFKLENVSDKDLYNLSFGITGAEQFKVFGFGSATAEFPLTHEDFGGSMTQPIDVLKPGGSITIDFTTTTWFNSALELVDLGPLDVGYYLKGVFVTTLGESTTEIPYTVNITHVKHGSFFEWDNIKDFVRDEVVDLIDENFLGDFGYLRGSKIRYKFITDDTTGPSSHAEVTLDNGSFYPLYPPPESYQRSHNVNVITMYTDASEENYSISTDGRTLTLDGSANIYVLAEAAGNATMTVTTWTYDTKTNEFVPNVHTMNYTVSSKEGEAHKVILDEPVVDTVSIPMAGNTTKVFFPHTFLDENDNYLSDASNAQWTIIGTDTTGLTIDKGVLTIVSTAKVGTYTVRLVLNETEYAEQSITLIVEAGKDYIDGSLIIEQQSPVNKGVELSLKENGDTSNGSYINDSAVTNDSNDYTVQWLRDGEPISGASGITYTTTDTDRGCVISLMALAKGDIYIGSIISNGIGVQTEPSTISLNATAGNSQATLSWNVTDDGGSDITKYVVYIKSGEDAYDAGLTLAANVTSYTFAGLENDTEYTFKVEAYNTTLIGTEQSGYAEATAKPSAPEPTGDSGGGGAVREQETVIVPVSGWDNSIDVNASVEGNTVTLDFDLNELNQVIGNESQTGNIVLDLSGIEETIDSFVIPSDAVNAITDSVNNSANDTLSMKINMGAVKVELDTKTLNTINEVKGDLKLAATMIPVSQLSSTQKAQIGEDAIVIDLQLWKGSTQIHDFEGGNITVSIPYEGEPKDGMVVWRMVTNAAGQIELTPMSVTINTQTKCYEFQTGQFSEYVLVYFPFADVEGERWYYENIAYAFKNGLFEGTGDTTFSPEATMTRAMLVTVLWRMEEKPTAHASDFTDLTAEWYKTAVAWAAKNGIVEGYGNNQFGPDDVITREQMAAVLYRYAQYKGYKVGGASDLVGFDDESSISGWAVPTMTWAVSAKLIQGDGSRLMPLGGAQRAQVAAILQRFIENVE